MPGGHEGRGGTQVKFSDNMDWWCSRMLPRDDLETIPFVGDVSGVTPAACVLPEVRRRDVGQQRYGSGSPLVEYGQTDRNGFLQPAKNGRTKTVATSHGNLVLSASDKDYGFMPTADAVFFLRHEYLGSCAAAYPSRYYPQTWR